MATASCRYDSSSATYASSSTSVDADVGGVALGPVAARAGQPVEHQPAEALVVLGEVVDRRARGGRPAGRCTSRPQSKSLGHSTLNENCDLGEQRVEAGGRRRRCPALARGAKRVAREVAARGRCARPARGRARRAPSTQRRRRSPAGQRVGGRRPTRRRRPRSARRRRSRRSRGVERRRTGSSSRTNSVRWRSASVGLVGVAHLEVLDAVEQCRAWLDRLEPALVAAA